MINFAVLGVGRIGKIHAQNVSLNSKCTLKVVADPWVQGTVNRTGFVGESIF